MKQPYGEDDLGFHLHHPTGDSRRQFIPPRPLDPRIAPVGDEQGGLPGHFGEHLRRGADVDIKGHAPLFQIVAYLLESGGHKGEMPEVCLRIGGVQDEDHPYRQVQVVGLADGVFQGVVSRCPLGRLHPVQDIPAPTEGTVVAVMQPLCGNHDLLRSHRPVCAGVPTAFPLRWLS